MIRVSAVVLFLGMSAFSAKAIEFMWGVTGAGGAASDLYAINPANGQLLGVVGNTGAVCLSGLAVQPGTGVLLAAQGQLSPTGASAKGLYRIDKTTGAATLIGSLDPKYAVSDVAMRADGTLFAFGIGQAVKKLMTINTSTGVPAEIGNTNNISNVSLTFGATGILYLVRTNGLFTVNTTTGVMSAMPIALNGATNQIDNLMATSAGGTIYAGLRVGAGTQIFTLNPANGSTALVGTAAAPLSGIAFDNAGPPTMAVKGKKKLQTTKSTVTLKGTASSLLPLTVSAKKTKTVKVVNGNWTLKAKLKSGKNVIKLACVDGFGQTATAKVTVVRN